MVFSNLLFIYLFLPLCLLLYYICKNRTYRNGILIIFSLLFYSFGEPVWVVLLIFSAIVDYLNGLFIEKYRGKKIAVLGCWAFSNTADLSYRISIHFSDFPLMFRSLLFLQEFPFTPSRLFPILWTYTGTKQRYSIISLIFFFMFQCFFSLLQVLSSDIPILPPRQRNAAAPLRI